MMIVSAILSGIGIFFLFNHLPLGVAFVAMGASTLCLSLGGDDK